MPLDRERILNGTILIVDDVDANRQLIQRRLARLGYHTAEASSGPEALRKIDREMPALVLLDYMMPEMSGIEVLEVLRDIWQVTNLPVIMLTAWTDTDIQVSALQAGAEDYVSKPIDFNVLDARIQSQLKRAAIVGALRTVHEKLGNRAALRILAVQELQDELRREHQLRQDEQLGNCTPGHEDLMKSIQSARNCVVEAIAKLDAGGEASKEGLLAILNCLEDGDVLRPEIAGDRGDRVNTGLPVSKR